MKKSTQAQVPTPAPADHYDAKAALQTIKAETTWDPDRFTIDVRFRAGDVNKFRSVHTMQEVVGHLATEAGKNTEVEGLFLEVASDGTYRYRKIRNRKEFLEHWQKNAKVRKPREARRLQGRKNKLRENDPFPYDGGGYGSTAGSNAGLVGDDFVPLLSGPYFKQPYLTDYLRAHSYAFFEYHHHPIAKSIVEMTVDFTLGRGFRVVSDNKDALALWQAFEQVNNLEILMRQVVREGEIYGENLIWWLPNQEVYIGYDDYPSQRPARGIIPRVRLVDPSTCWEIVTYPEDITRVLFYQLMFPTQYQIFTGSDKGKPVNTAKFVMQQVPAEDMMHFKYNCVSNEKRGRSTLYPILGYLKWTRDCTQYKLIALKKQAAWTEDIVVEGSQVDVDNLANALANLGEFEPAGSRFIHTNKIKREYLSTAAGGNRGSDDTLMWGVNMCAVGVGIPVTYFGFSDSAAQTKGAAIVGTEPVAKKFERRQQDCTRIIKAMWRKLQDEYGIKGAECEVIFPEIITQDRSTKLKDIKFAEASGYISRETAAPLAAKELGIENYEFKKELVQMDAEGPEVSPAAPLTSPGLPKPEDAQSTAALPAADKKAFKDDQGRK